MGSLRETKRRRRKQAILQAAAKLIASGGLEACTMRKLARAAQLDVVTLYHHYGSKHAILEALRRSAARALHRDIENVEEKETVDRIRAIVGLSLRVGAAPIDVVGRLLVAKVVSRRPQEGPLLAALKERLVPELELAIEEGLLAPSINADLLATEILVDFRTWVPLWGNKVIDADELEARVDYGVSLGLLAASTALTRPRLETDLQEGQRRLAALSSAEEEEASLHQRVGAG